MATLKRRRITLFPPRLWARHRDLATKLKLDLEVALRDATARDATERAAVEQPLVYSKGANDAGFGFLVPHDRQVKQAPFVPRGRHTQIVHDIKQETEEREKQQRLRQEREAQRRRAMEPGQQTTQKGADDFDAPPDFERATVLASFIKVSKKDEPAAPRASTSQSSRASSSRAQSRGS